jgi:hypothetical protein
VGGEAINLPQSPCISCHTIGGMDPWDVSTLLETFTWTLPVIEANYYLLRRDAVSSGTKPKSPKKVLLFLRLQEVTNQNRPAPYSLVALFTLRT